MPRPEIEEFAKLLIEVRDRSIEGCDSNLEPETKGPVAERWRSQLGAGSPKDVALTVIPDCVDETLFYLLEAIDSGLLRISFTASNGNVIDLPSEGMAELAGWYMGSEGWRRAHSGQRFIDDFEDLA